MGCHSLFQPRHSASLSMLHATNDALIPAHHHRGSSSSSSLLCISSSSIHTGHRLIWSTIPPRHANGPLCCHTAPSAFYILQDYTATKAIQLPKSTSIPRIGSIATPDFACLSKDPACVPPWKGSSASASASASLPSPSAATDIHSPHRRYSKLSDQVMSISL